MRPRGEALRERLRRSLRNELPDCRVSFEAGDIVTPGDELRFADSGRGRVQGVNLQDDYAYAQKVRASWPG